MYKKALILEPLLINSWLSYIEEFCTKKSYLGNVYNECFAVHTKLSSNWHYQHNGILEKKKQILIHSFI